MKKHPPRAWSQHNPFSSLQDFGYPCTSTRHVSQAAESGTLTAAGHVEPSHLNYQAMDPAQQAQILTHSAWPVFRALRPVVLWWWSLYSKRILLVHSPSLPTLCILTRPLTQNASVSTLPFLLHPERKYRLSPWMISFAFPPCPVFRWSPDFWPFCLIFTVKHCASQLGGFLFLSEGESVLHTCRLASFQGAPRPVRPNSLFLQPFDVGMSVSLETAEFQQRFWWSLQRAAGNRASWSFWVLKDLSHASDAENFSFQLAVSFE